jgi:hypothetical protein
MFGRIIPKIERQNKKSVLKFGPVNDDKGISGSGQITAL